jgi:hypothetical protein
MATWCACPGCGLKHTARVDGRCPRCSTPVAAHADGGGTPAPPEPPPPAAAPPTPAAPPRLPLQAPAETSTSGELAAACILCANALVGVGVLLLTGTNPSDPRGMGSLVPVVVDLVVATRLFQKERNAPSWALARAVLGGLVLTPILWSNGGAIVGIAQLVFSAGLVALLVGEPGRARVAGGALGAGGAVALVFAMVALPRVGNSVRALAADVGDWGTHVERLEGRDGAWSLPLPPRRWHDWPEGAKAVQGADRAATWPEEDAALMVFAIAAPEGRALDLGAAAEVILANIRKADRTYSELGRMRVRLAHGPGLAIHMRTTHGGRLAEGWCLFATSASAGRIAVVLTLGPAERFEELGAELREVASQIDVAEPRASVAPASAPRARVLGGG